MDMHRMLCILVWAITSKLVAAIEGCNRDIDPCLDGNNVALNDPSRSPTLQRPWNYTHDYNIETNWYRSTNWVGGEMPTGRVGSGRCSAVCPIWINDTLPSSPQEGIVDLNACATYLNVDCVRRYIIATKNCGDFNVYCLYPTEHMYDRYCMEYVEYPDIPPSTSTTPTSQTSSTTPTTTATTEEGSNNHAVIAVVVSVLALAVAVVALTVGFFWGKVSRAKHIRKDIYKNQVAPEPYPSAPPHVLANCTYVNVEAPPAYATLEFNEKPRYVALP